MGRGGSDRFPVLGAEANNVCTRLLKGTGIIESFFPYSGSPPLFKGTRIIESCFGQGEKIKKKNSPKQI